MGGDLFPFLTMVIVQLGYAGMTIISKVAMDSGMDPFVHVAYRQIFATVAIAPFAYFLERKTRPKMTLPVIFQIFLSSIFGVTLNQMTYFIGLKNTTPTIASALSNLLPAVTFLLTVPLGLENVGIKTKPGQAKVLGTVVCVGGAMLLSFYHGPAINIGESSIHWKYAESMRNRNHSNSNNFILGPLLLIASTIFMAVWFVIQARLSNSYPAPYSSSALMCFMSSIQCVIIGFFAKGDISAWALSSGIRAVSSLYAGIVCSALAFCLMSWCIERKGPLYVSVFSPLLLIIVAIVSWALLREKLFVGTVSGSALIVMGLYGVLWGNTKEVKAKNHIQEQSCEEKQDAKEDLEIQFRYQQKELQFSEHLKNNNNHLHAKF